VIDTSDQSLSYNLAKLCIDVYMNVNVVAYHDGPHTAYNIYVYTSL
jgi:hypothetical protein